MSLTNLTIKDLLTPNAKLTFLVGAGCSVDAPSCLPAGKQMMDALIDYTCIESEIEKIKELKDLRFEHLVGIIQKELDPELKIIDYYGKSDKPNLQHFFLAEMLKQGHFVLTTNFDFLIELALQQSGVPKEEIRVVITKNDFETYNNPPELYSNGIKALYKIHGSTKNQITQEDTRDSLITTIQRLGVGKKGENVFQIEPFKRPLFDNIMKNRTLVIIGYSGSDDFDIVPTLRVLKNLQNLIWIKHISEDGGKEKIYEIVSEIKKTTKSLDKVNKILSDMYAMSSAKHIYRVESNTSRLLEKFLRSPLSISTNQFSLYPLDWFKTNINSPGIFYKYAIPYKIYFDFGMYNESIHCLEMILFLAENIRNKSWESYAYSGLGLICNIQGKYSEALNLIEKSLNINDQLGELSKKATDFNNFGLTYHDLGNYSKALEQYNKALKIDKQLGELSKIAIDLCNIASIYHEQQNYLKAIENYEKALEITEQQGDLSTKALLLNNIGRLFYNQKKIPEALEKYEEALDIAEQLTDLYLKASILNNIGMIYHDQKLYQEALKAYEVAIYIFEQLGILPKKMDILINTAITIKLQGNFIEVIKRYQDALEIAENLKDYSKKAFILRSIGRIFYEIGNYTMALKKYEEVLEIVERLGDSSRKALILNEIGMVYDTLRNYPEALKRYDLALEIWNDLGNLSNVKILEKKIQYIKKEQEKS